MAVFVYYGNDGKQQFRVAPNVARGLHSERVLEAMLKAEHVPDDKVISVYSERVPCTVNRDDARCESLLKQYVNADITYSLDSKDSAKNAAAIEDYINEIRHGKMKPATVAMSGSGPVTARIGRPEVARWQLAA